MVEEAEKVAAAKVVDDDVGDINDGGGEDRTDNKAPFTAFSTGLTTAEADELRVKWGKNELEEKSTPKWLVFLQILYQPMPLMIWTCIIIELGIQNWLDAGILLIIQFVNATLGWYETVKAADAVAALKASLKPVATVKRDGVWANTDAGLLVPGDLVLLGSGSNVPADCIVNHGTIDVDQSGLTGESLPVTMFRGDSAKMGSTVVKGEVEATVESTGGNTFFGKTASLLQSVDGMGHLQLILMRIVLVLVVMSILVSVILLIYLCVNVPPAPFRRENFKEALTFVVVVLVASIPIAIEIVCTATLALGSRQLSAEGAIVTRLGSIEEMAGMNMLCSDKTGTLTLNKMVIQEDCPVYTPGMDQREVLRMAALAARWREPPRDALDTLVLTQADLPSLDHFEQLEFVPFDPTVKRTEGTIRDPTTGRTFKCTKGAPNVLVKLVEVDREEVQKRVDWKVTDLARRGIRSLAVARTNDDGKWQMLGILTFLDPPRPDTKITIERAMEAGVDVKMITGDHAIIAKETARQLGLGTNIPDATGLPTLGEDGKIPKDLGQKYGRMIIEADGFAGVFPEHKYLIVEALRQEGFACGMTGDGVNDAPALKRADVGIAVQGATDAARAAADMVLTQPGLSVIVTAIQVSRSIFQRMKNFINYRIACTLQLLWFFFFAVLFIHPGAYPSRYEEMVESAEIAGARGLKDSEAIISYYFKMPVLMLMLITVLNDGTLISVAYDHVVPSKHPEKWNLKCLWIVSAVLALPALGSSLLLLWAALESFRPGSLFSRMGLPGVPYPKVITMMYLKISVSDFLTLFAARTHTGMFFSMRPGYLLLGLATMALAISTLVACLWPDSFPDKVHTRGLVVKSREPIMDPKVAASDAYTLWPLWVWLYCFVWFVVQDVLKLGAYTLMRKVNLFGINTAKYVNVRDATSFGDRPLARASAGMVEAKVLDMKVANAQAGVAEAADRAGDPNLRRMSQDLGIMRNSVKLARQSIGQAVVRGPGTDVEAGLSDEMARMKDTIAQLERAAAAAPAAERAAITSQLDEVRNAYVKMEKVNALARSGAA